MMNDPNKQKILQQIATISTMERGKLSAYTFEERSGVAGPYHKLQHWHNGRNHTRYVSAHELPAMQAALAGYAQYQQLTEQYADLVIKETRQSMADSKKTNPTADPPCPRRGNPTTDRPFSIARSTGKRRSPIRGVGTHRRLQICQ